MQKVMKAENIVSLLRKVEILINQGKTVPLSCKECGISDSTYYKWRRQYGGLGLRVSERRACEVLDLNRTTKRYKAKKLDDEDLLKEDIIRLASKYGRYGYRRITALLKAEGWRVNHKRVERIWRELGLRVPKKQKKRGRLYLGNGSCIILKPLYQNHVWSYDCVEDRLACCRKYKCLTIMDEFTRESLKIRV